MLIPRQHTPDTLESGIQFNARYMGTFMVKDGMGLSATAQKRVQQITKRVYDMNEPGERVVVTVTPLEITISDRVRAPLDVVAFVSALGGYGRGFYVVTNHCGRSLVHVLTALDLGDSREFIMTCTQAFDVRMQKLETLSLPRDTDLRLKGEIRRLS